MGRHVKDPADLHRGYCPTINSFKQASFATFMKIYQRLFPVGTTVLVMLRAGGILLQNGRKSHMCPRGIFT